MNASKTFEQKVAELTNRGVCLGAAVNIVMRPAAPAPTCPGCSGQGRPTTVNPKVLTCTGCGGLFTAEPITAEQALVFVAIDQPMKAEADLPGAFYFDLVLSDGRMAGRRVHGWADRNTKRVVQWG